MVTMSAARFAGAAVIFAGTVALILHGIGHHKEPTAVAKAAPIPFTCAVVGDSIADMVQDFLPECSHNTKIGISSAAVLARVMATPAVSMLVISAGSNDPDNPNLAANLRRIRAKGNVVWIQPSVAVQRARTVVGQVAAEKNDPVVPFRSGCCGLQARVHPIAPREIAAAIRKLPTWGKSQ
jgi:hypothetical protein